MLPLGIALHARAALQLAPACAVNASLHAAQLLSFATHASEHSKPGVFGVPGLHTPADFQRLQQQARARCDELISQVLAAPPDASVVKCMDDMSDELCRTYDAAEACRNIHDDQAWRSAATKVCMDLGAYISEVNHHQGLYKALARALGKYEADSAQAAGRDSSNTAIGAATSSAAARTQSLASGSEPVHQGQPHGQQPEGWCEEAVMVGRALIRDMQQAGIHLPTETQRARMQELMNANAHYAAQFNHAQRDPKQLGSIKLVLPAKPKGGLLSGQLWGRSTRTVPLDPMSVAQVMACEADENIRKQVYMAASQTPASNLQLLERMVGARREMATAVGCPSYSHFKAAGGSLAREPAAVVAFLRQLGEAVKGKADAEVAVLQKHKASELQSVEPHTMRPWDIEMMSARARWAAAEAAGGVVPRSALDQYTQLSSVLQGLVELVSRVLRISLKLTPAPAAEAWAQHVIKCEASHPDLGFLGTVYMDLCSRPGKYPSAVTFPIRCGKELADGEYQTPIMALLADFGASGSAPDQVKLSMRELRTLVHEMGHCVHNLVSRTRFQHLWGTRCAQDIVEVPSHLFEHWAADPRSLGILARHASSREPMPVPMMKRLAAASGALSGLELQQQVLLALVDQRYFGPTPVAPGGTGEAWREACEGLASIPPVPGTHPEARMGHLTIYGATYYSYVYARCLSAAMWNKLLVHDPLDPEAGATVMERLLRPGGTRDPLAVVASVLGGENQLQEIEGGWAPKTDDLLLRTALATFA